MGWLKSKILISLRINLFNFVQSFSSSSCLDDEFYSGYSVRNSLSLLETSNLFICRFVKEFESIGVKVKIKEFLPQLNKTHKFCLEPYCDFSFLIGSFHICGHYKCFLLLPLIWHFSEFYNYYTDYCFIFYAKIIKQNKKTRYF